MSHPLEPWLAESLGHLGEVRVRPMFGGHGVSLDGLSIGLIDGEVLYLKVDAATVARFDAEGLEPFTYDKNGVPVAMNYRRAPDAAHDDAEAMAEWAGLALEAARRVKRPPRGRARP